MQKIILLLIFILCFSFSYSQNVKINGIAKAYENKEIAVWVNNDYISNTQKQLTYSNVDSAGNFLLEFNSKAVQYITLKIEKSIASMYIEPNANYEILILPPDSSTYQNPNLEHDVRISIKLKSKTEINALTMDYDKRFDDFLSVNYKDFVSRRSKPATDSFKLAMLDYYSTVKNQYFDAYINYTIAALEEKTNVSPKKLYEDYLQGKPVLYFDPEYMNFFNAFYKQKLQNYSLTKAGKSLKFQIDGRGSFKGAMDVLRQDAFLKNDTIRELVVIKGLYESYYDGAFQRKNIIPMLRQVVEESKIQEHQRIAQNILNSFSKLKVGGAAPFFELPDKTGATHSLDELRSKKYIYLMFFDKNCTACIQQMKIIPSLKKQYGERIEFVSVSTDNSAVDLKNFCTKNPKYDWLFLYDNSGATFKNNYEIKSLPAYFLISPEGKFIQVPAESPDGDIDRAFFDITKPKGKKWGVGDKKNR